MGATHIEKGHELNKNLAKQIFLIRRIYQRDHWRLIDEAAAEKQEDLFSETAIDHSFA